MVGTQNLRTDLVIQKNNQFMIIDVTVPFEDGLQAFEEARKRKVEKYQYLIINPEVKSLLSLRASSLTRLDHWTR